MNDLMSTANTWVSSNQTVVALALLTTLVVARVSLLSNHANVAVQKNELNLRKRIWAWDNRKIEIERLRTLFAKFAAISFNTSFDPKNLHAHGRVGYISGPNGLEKPNRFMKCLKRNHYSEVSN